MSQASRIGAHASALISLRSKSLAAYGINPHALIIAETHTLMNMADHTQTLAQVSRESRSLAIESDHSLVLV